MVDFLKSNIYSHAPITEAVIDFRVANEIKDEHLDKVAKKLKKFYPNEEKTTAVDLAIDAEIGRAMVRKRNEGFRLSNEDKNEIVILQPTGITKSQLAPYSGWESLQESAQKVFAEWRKIIPHQPISRIGVRFLNRIDIPLDHTEGVDIRDYLHFYPHNPCQSAGGLINHVIQVTHPSVLPNWMNSISSTVAPPPVPRHFSLLLDIDVSRTSEIPLKEEDLWAVTNEARLIKNDIFERCITDKTRALIS